MAQREHPRAHELCGRPAQHPGKPDAHVGGGGPVRGQRTRGQQGQPHARLPVFHGHAGRPFHTGARPARRRGVPSSFSRARLFHRAVRLSAVALRVRLRGNRDLQPVSVEHGYAEASGRTGRLQGLRPSLFRRGGPAGRREPHTGERQGLSRRRGAGHCGSARDLGGRPCRARRLASLAQQRHRYHSHRRRGFHQQHVPDRHRRPGEVLRLPGRRTPVVGCLAVGATGRTNVRDKRTAA